MSLFSRPVRRQRWMRLTLATLIISAATVLGLAASSLSAVAQPAGPAPGCGQPGGQTGNAACLTVPPAAGYIPRGSTSGLDTIDGTSGVPLGGVGAGSVKFWPTRGTFSAVETTPADVNDYQTLPGAAFQLYTDRAGNVQANSQLKALSADGRSADQAIFPEQLANLGSLNGVEVGLTAFSPFDQKSHWAISPAAYAVRLAGSGGRQAGRSSRTRSFSTVRPRSQPIRSAITVAGLRG